MDIPPPPRDEWSFREFYTARRARMIGLVRVQAAGWVSDPELVAEDGWCKFFPHWKDCEYPDAYVRVCMVGAANDALRAVRSERPLYSPGREPGSASPGLSAELDDKPWDVELTGAFNRKKRAYAQLRRLLPVNYLELREARRGRSGVEGWSTP
jgi:hypothetical protein